jgi:hypothetical protein
MGGLRQLSEHLARPAEEGACGVMQCKDIPDRPILEWLATRNGRWAHWFSDDENSVRNAMPPGVPDKLVPAKMAMLGRRGLVDGCFCGCRGDYVITEKGREYLCS